MTEDNGAEKPDFLMVWAGVYDCNLHGVIAFRLADGIAPSMLDGIKEWMKELADKRAVVRLEVTVINSD